MTKSVRVRLVVGAGLLAAQVAAGQVREIDAGKLPQDGATQATYKRLAANERYGQAWSNKWAYDLPKAEVVEIYTVSLAQLTEATKAAPENHELQLLAGLTAHFAYNVDLEEAYEPAMKFLEAAGASDAGDYRAKWFLGMQECQANQGDKGMPLLLGVEDSMEWQKLPVDFWTDYVTCATVTGMPAHALRAIGRAVAGGAAAGDFEFLKGANEKRFLASDVKKEYASKEVWAGEGVNGDVVLTSRLCGISLTAHGDWGTNAYDVKNGTCALVLQPPAYVAKVGKSSPSLMIMSQPAGTGETLEDFVHKFLKGRYAEARPVAGLDCPSKPCVAYEVIDKAMYAEEGGAHLMVVAFAREMPEFDGLMFERAEAPPKPEGEGKMTYFRPGEGYHRLPGKRYFLVLLDSNAAIFDAAKQDYDFFLKSIRVE